MGLRGTIRIGGVPLGYHRIAQLAIGVNSGNCITIMSYIDKEERDKEDDASSEQPYRIGWFAETAYDPGMSVDDAYEYIKTLPEFESAEDVIEGGAEVETDGEVG